MLNKHQCVDCNQCVAKQVRNQPTILSSSNSTNLNSDNYKVVEIISLRKGGCDTPIFQHYLIILQMKVVKASSILSKTQSEIKHFIWDASKRDDFKSETHLFNQKKID